MIGDNTTGTMAMFAAAAAALWAISFLSYKVRP